MNIHETLELITNTRELLIEDYNSCYKKSPSNKELLLHVKNIIKEGNIECFLEDIILDGEIEDVDNFYKKLLLVSAAVKDSGL